MSFAFCVYYSNDRRQLALHPKLILLDEIDAPLHPSMSKNLIQTIRNTLVGAYGIKVILTTHSPSTVAIAPEDSIYAMKPNTPGLHKISRAQALNLLTVGVPTLAISYEGRRQVFVESPSDAEIYDSIYKLLKSKISSERSLEFVATGTRTKNGDINTGCELVKRLVSDLKAAGNQSVFGLIDWDGKHSSTERIAVLAEGARNGLENLLFDPLAIALLVCRDFPPNRDLLGILPDMSFISLAANPNSMQEAAERVVERVLGRKAASTTTVEYVGGLTLKVDVNYLLMDDHALEDKVLAAFPFLKSISRQHPAKLGLHIVATVFTDLPHAIPKDFQTVLEDLLGRSAH